MSGDATIEIHVRVNGEVTALPAGASVADLVERLGHRPETVAVEVDRELVPRGERGRHRLSGGERVELVTLVGGG